MKKYVFILGHNPILSIAEIFRLSENEKTKFKIIDVISDCLIIESAEINIEKWQSKLGGTIKIGKNKNSHKEQNEIFK